MKFQWEIRMKAIALGLFLILLLPLYGSIEADQYYDSLGMKLLSNRESIEALNYFNKSLAQNETNLETWIHK